MRAGSARIGHPVDVATGAVYVKRQDIEISGRVPLIWERRYSTALLAMPTTPLGPGWTTRFFATLSKEPGQYRLLTPEGYEETFSNAAGQVEQGHTSHNFGTFQELTKRGADHVVTRWACTNRKSRGVDLSE